MKEILVLIEVIKLVKVKKAIQNSQYKKELNLYNINKRTDKKLEEAKDIHFLRELQKQYEIPPKPRATSNEIHAFIVMVLETGNTGTNVLNIFKEENKKSKRWREVIARQKAGKLFKKVLLSYKEHPAIIRMIDNKMYNEKDILNSSLTGALNSYNSSFKTNTLFNITINPFLLRRMIMKNTKKNFLIVIAIIMSGCAATKNWSATGGSRADGTVKLSYEYGVFEMPQLNEQEAITLAQKRCSSWGYNSAEAFGGVTKTCNQPSSNDCLGWLVTKEYQCIGSLEK